MTPKIKKILIIGYIVTMILGTAFVASVLKTNNVQVINKDPDKTTQEVKPATVSLQLKEGAKTSTYVYTMRNIDTLSDLLKTARDDKKIYYEKTQYIDKVVIDNVNNINSTDKLAWRLFLKERDVTNQMNDLKISDNDVFQLMLVPVTK